MKLTPEIKLEAIANKYYRPVDPMKGYDWQPRVGDYYTIVRADLILFQIASNDGANFKVIEVGGSGQWTFPVQGFATSGFGFNRVHVVPILVERMRNPGAKQDVEGSGNIVLGAPGGSGR